MLKVWGRANSSNVQKVLWGCAEMGVEFERIDAGMQFGRTKDPHYLAMNPMGLVPTVEDGKAVIWESNTILRYLATTRGHEHLYPMEPVARSQVERWMDWQISHLAPPMAVLLFGYYRTSPERRDSGALDTARQRCLDLWRIVEGAMKDNRPYLSGQEFSLADICVGMFIHRWYNYPVERQNTPHLKAWYERLSARPAYKTHVLGPIS